MALLSLLLPLFGIFSAASVGLVTLRKGAKSGAIVSLLATLASGLFLAVSFGQPLLALFFLLMMWAPMVLIGMFLRESRLLDISMQLILGIGVLVILGQYLLLGDPAAHWETLLQPLVEQFVTTGVMDEAASQVLLTQLAAWMTGVVAAALFLQLALSLLVARWWQALLYNPGGFKEEFHRFRLHKMIGVVGIPAMIILLMQIQEVPDIFRHLAILLMAALFLGGLAVAHGILGKMNSGGIWLGVIYFLLFFLLPQVVMLLATVGLMDVWIDFRARFERSRSTG